MNLDNPHIIEDVSIPVEDNLHFELVIGKKDGNIDNASIPIRWCLTKELLDSINESAYKSPQVLIQVQYVTFGKNMQQTVLKEERHVFSLNQFIAYVPLSRPGAVVVNAFIVGTVLGDVKGYVRSLTYQSGYDHNRYWWDELEHGLPIPMRLSQHDDAVIDIISMTLGYKLTIPETVFGKTPPTWFLDLLNRYQESTIVDQCNLRRRMMFFPIKLIFIMLEALIRFIGIFVSYLTLFVLGFEQIETRYLRHPLLYGWNCYSSGDYKFCLMKYKKQITNQPNIPVRALIKCLLVFLYRIPATTLITSGITWWIFSKIVFGWQLLLFCLASPLAIAAVVLGLVVGILVVFLVKSGIDFIDSHSILRKIFGPIGRVIIAPFDWLVSKHYQFINWTIDLEIARDRANLLKLEKYLTCNKDPHSVTADVGAIPFFDQSLKLKYTNFKNKVCRPLIVR